VTLELPDNDGGMTRVRISVRGDQVRATLVASDAATSAQLSSQAPELERALAARGFRAADISVPQAISASPLRETGSGAALGIASADSASGERLQGNNRHADGSAGESRQGTAERDRESPDQEAEDQPRQGRSHQRARRERAR
jgi:flagellar hook-length control protein FliK